MSELDIDGKFSAAVHSTEIYLLLPLSASSSLSIYSRGQSSLMLLCPTKLCIKEGRLV